MGTGSGDFAADLQRIGEIYRKLCSRDSTKDNDALSHNYGQDTDIYYRTTSIGS